MSNYRYECTEILVQKQDQTCEIRTRVDEWRTFATMFSIIYISVWPAQRFVQHEKTLNLQLTLPANVKENKHLKIFECQIT